jgi:ATP-dependent Clp protease protease subunit
MAEQDRNSRVLVLSGDIDDKMVTPLIHMIVEINEEDAMLTKTIKEYNPEPIKLIVNSSGGECYAGLALIGAMEMSNTPIQTFAVGKAMSMALFIVAAGDERYAHRMTTFMYHEIADWNIGKLESQKRQMKESERLQRMMDEFLMARTLIKPAKIRKDKDELTDWYFDAKEALDLNVIDYVIAKVPVQDNQTDAEGKPTKPKNTKKAPTKKTPAKKASKVASIS